MVTGSVLLPGCREREVSVGDEFERHPSGLWVPGEEIPEPLLLAIDLFAGAGGMSCGFHQAGLHVIAASEAWHVAAITYLLNLGSPATAVHVLDPIEGDKDTTKHVRRFHEQHAGETVTATELFEHHDVDGLPGDGWISARRDHSPENCPAPHLQDDPEGLRWFCETYHAVPPHPEAACEHLYLGDVRGLTGERILDDLDCASDDIAVVAGGPPCQGFSHAGQRNVEDPRNSLVFEFMRLCTEIHPRAFMMENVPGILSMVTPEGIPVVDALARIAEDGNFGTYDAIRKSLLASSGCGAALRGKSTTDSDDEEPDAVDEQLAMEMA